MKKLILFPFFVIIIFLIGLAFLIGLKTPKKINQSMPKKTAVTYSNQWYSNIYKNFPTEPIYAIPLAYKLSQQGISISFPDVQKTQNSILAPFDQDLTIGFESKLSKPKIKSIGDWNINLLMNSKNNHTIDFNLVKGLPYIVFNTIGEKILITLHKDFQFLDNNKKLVSVGEHTTDNFLLYTSSHKYAVVLAKKVKIKIENQTITLENPEKISVGILDDTESYDLFRKSSLTEVTNTQYTPTITNTQLLTQYSFVTNSAAPLITLLPHQKETLDKNLQILGQYETLRGNIYLARTNTFTTKTQLITPPASFKPLSQKHTDFTDALQKDIADYITSTPPDSQDYFLGTWFGKGANLLLLANMHGFEKEKNDLIRYLKPKFIRSLEGFTYDAKKDSLIATKPEFGNENLNDHHFHYGYYIRAAAILSLLDPTILLEINGPVGQMVQDIANTDKNSTKYPYLRNFDIYESHSWADGFANFADGNNQESSSEAIHTWYSLYLWSKATQNKALENTALFLYNSEIQGALFYWFGKNQMHAWPYSHAIAGIVWGGKIDFATWFSDETNMKYGIQLLPLTPGSIYLSTFENFTDFEADFRYSGGGEEKEWGDLFLVWKSFYNPTEALKFTNTTLKPEPNTPRSLFLYFLYHNNNQ